MRTLAAAAVLLAAAAWWWRSQQQQADQADAGAWWPADNFDPYAADADWQPDPEPTEPDWTDEVQAIAAAARNLVLPTPAAGMQLSAAGLAHMKRLEGCSLTRYRLGDGGWTIGYGRYYRDGGPVPPERIDQATAEAWLAEDAEERGARWVRTYVTADLTQPQFDALVSMAYNLSPRSFKTIADAVNAGESPDAAALRYVRAGTNLERGLRNRRAAELALFHTEPTAA